jgi:hypothetical protein
MLRVDVGDKRGKTMKVTRWKYALVGLTTGLIAISISRGELIVYDGFDYSAGYSLNGLGHEGYAWGTQMWTRTSTASDWEVYDESLVHPSVYATGGHVAETNSIDGAGYKRSFEPVILSDGETLWFSFLVELIQEATWNLFFNSSDLNESKFGIQGSHVNSLMRARIGVGTAPSDDAIELGIGVIRYVVGRYQYFDDSPDQMDIWLDTPTDTDPGWGDSSSTNHIVYYRSPESTHDPEPHIIDSVLLENRSIGRLRFDELRVGTTWQSVNGRALDRVRASQVSLGPGSIEIDLKHLTPGATTVVETASSLISPITWTPIDSILVTNRTLIWGNSVNEGVGFYRFRTQ